MKFNKELWAAFLLGNAGLLMIYLLPIMVGAVSEQFNLTPQQSGLFAACDLIGYSMSSISSFFWINKTNWKRMAIISVLVMICGNALATIVGSFPVLLLIRWLTGLGQGIGVALTLAVINKFGDTDRNFAAYLIITLVFGALCMEGISFFPNYEKADVIYAMQIILAIICLPFVIQFMSKGGHQLEEKGSSQRIPILVFLCLLGVLLMFVGYGGLWSFTERIAVANHFDPEFVSTVLSSGLLIAIPALMIPLFIGSKYGRMLPISISILGLIIYSLCVGTDDKVYFTIGVLTGSFGVNLIIPYLTGIIADQDQSGKGVVMVTPMYSIGFAMGPLFLSMITTDGNYLVLSIVSVAIFLMVYITYLSVLIKKPATNE
ncbi:MFS transporter [Flammeovirga sp. MY04]|uniref:MFS transporter n=1 Tax=Flammeovirga sp. MY04 TaxID=1191459 RepID=UPI0008060F7B|nr:MFS transporter [Flammeovirga sp. MY04]ANQ48852.1 MFS transporter [Flammeovirga sp. MY04]